MSMIWIHSSSWSVNFVDGWSHNKSLICLLGQVLAFLLVGSRSIVCISNTHIYYNMRRGEVKLAQMAYLISSMHKMGWKEAFWSIFCTNIDWSIDTDWEPDQSGQKQTLCRPHPLRRFQHGAIITSPQVLNYGGANANYGGANAAMGRKILACQKIALQFSQWKFM